MSEINGKTLSISFSRIIRCAQNAAGCFVKPYGGGLFRIRHHRFVNDFVHDSQKEIQWEITSQEGA